MSDELTVIKPPGRMVRVRSLVRTGPRALGLRFYEAFTRWLRGYPVWGLTRITPQLYVGGQQRPRGWQKMEEEGITAVVNMRESKYDDVAKGVGGVRHLHLPTIDNTPPSVEVLQQGTDFIKEEIEQGGKVYVHCGLGVGRAPTMAAAYLIHEGMTPDEALTTLTKVRPFVHITTDQRKRLDEFADYIQNGAGES